MIFFTNKMDTFRTKEMNSQVRNRGDHMLACWGEEAWSREHGAWGRGRRKEDRETDLAGATK